MTVLTCALILAASGSLAWLTQKFHEHGLAHVLDLLAAWLISLADGWRAFQAKRAESAVFNRDWAIGRK